MGRRWGEAVAVAVAQRRRWSWLEEGEGCKYQLKTKGEGRERDEEDAWLQVARWDGEPGGGRPRLRRRVVRGSVP